MISYNKLFVCQQHMTAAVVNPDRIQSRDSHSFMFILHPLVIKTGSAKLWCDFTTTDLSSQPTNILMYQSLIELFIF